MGNWVPCMGPPARGIFKISPNTRIFHLMIEMCANLGVRTTRRCPVGERESHKCREVLRWTNRPGVQALHMMQLAIVVLCR